MPNGDHVSDSEIIGGYLAREEERKVAEKLFKKLPPEIASTYLSEEHAFVPSQMFPGIVYQFSPHNSSVVVGFGNEAKSNWSADKIGEIDMGDWRKNERWAERNYRLIDRLLKDEAEFLNRGQWYIWPSEGSTKLNAKRGIEAEMGKLRAKYSKLFGK